MHIFTVAYFLHGFKALGTTFQRFGFCVMSADMLKSARYRRVCLDTKIAHASILACCGRR